jgi:hypothetical protein
MKYRVTLNQRIDARWIVTVEAKDRDEAVEKAYDSYEVMGIYDGGPDVEIELESVEEAEPWESIPIPTK